MSSFRILVLGFLFVSFRPSLIRSHSWSSGASLLLSLSGFPLPFRWMTSASLSVPATQPLFLPFLFLPGPASQWLLRCALPLSLLWLSPFFPTRFPVSSFPVFRTRLSVCFLSPFPDSLPQLFLRCFPFALAFGLSPSVPLDDLRFPFGSGYSASVSSFPSLPVSASQWLPRCALSAFASLAFPVLSNPVSRVFLLGSRTRLSVCFLSSLPVSLPQLFHRCFPLASAFGLFPLFRFLSSASVRF